MPHRRLGRKAFQVSIVLVVALSFAVTKLVTKDEDDPPAQVAAAATATATAGSCREVSDPFGPPPDSFEYEKVSEKTRASTVKALKLDEAGGKVEMRAARRTGLTLGTLVRVPSGDPAAYASQLVETAEGSGATVTKAKGYAVLPLQGGTVVAVGVRGCATILISAQDASAVPFLAGTVFGG